LASSLAVSLSDRACAAAPAPFLWLRFVGASEARDDLDRTAASWNVARAGVDGLLALPLFVVMVVTIVGGGITTGVGSFLFSTSSVFTESFLFGAIIAVSASAGSGSFLELALVLLLLLLFSTLLRPLGSLGGFGSPAERGQLAGGAKSGVPGGAPFGLFEAEEEGRAFPFSAGL
jgi:hypothetical protein